MDAVDQELKDQVDGLIAQMRSSASETQRADLLRQCNELLAKRRAIAPKRTGERE